MFEVNEYFDAKVKSIAFSTPEGPATVGVMAPGTYTFGTDHIEHMTLVSGQMKVKLPGETEFKTIAEKETFIVEANVQFDVEIGCETSYLCLYR
jgi:uncharacterized protein YaiE (UPF0345 family)